MIRDDTCIHSIACLWSERQPRWGDYAPNMLRRHASDSECIHSVAWFAASASQGSLLAHLQLTPFCPAAFSKELLSSWTFLFDDLLVKLDGHSL